MPHPKKQRTRAPRVTVDEQIDSSLGECIDRDAALLKREGWKALIRNRRKRGDFGDVGKLDHPASRLLLHYKKHGAPVKCHGRDWDKSLIDKALRRGPHRSCFEYIDFLEEEFVDMINKSQWIVLPFEDVKDLPGLRLSPPGVVPQRGRRPRWIVDYSFWGVNQDTLPLAPRDAMQFGHALDRILREVLLADPKHGLVELMKVDISDGFYRVNLALDDIAKLGVVFPVRDGQRPLVAFPLVLPMGWVNSPPIFCAATETAADIANANLQDTMRSSPHSLDTMAAPMDDDDEIEQRTGSDIVKPFSSPAAGPTISTTSSVPTESIKRDPSLPTGQEPIGYFDVFVDDFLGLVQGKHNRSRVRSTLLRAIDEVFRPNDFYDDLLRREPVSLKKLRQGDCSWNTIKVVLGWVLNTVAMTVELPQHRQERLAEILASIPVTQKRIAVKKWHKILGELRSMALALPGARNMFSQMQLALSNKIGSRVNTNKGVHQALDDFRWMLNDIKSRPTRIAELIPLLASALGYHDASGTGAGGVWFPHQSLDPRTKPGETPSHTPLVWRYKWPQDIIDALVTDDNPNGTITNSDLELAGGLLHLEAIAHHFDVRERTILSKTDNLATMFWQRKGSATSEKPPAYLLRLFGIHQRYHRYVPRHDYIPGKSNPMADDASRLFDLTDAQFLAYFNEQFKQAGSFRYVRLNSSVISSVTSALRRKVLPVDSLLADPLPVTPIGNNGPTSQLNWAAIPFSKPSKTKYLSYKSSCTEFVPADLQQTRIQSSQDRLKTTYGQLGRRSQQWVKETLA